MKKINLYMNKFIEHAQFVHRNKYDYSKIKYKNSTTRVAIICPRHGIFLQTPSAHLRFSGGCPYCSYNRLTIDEFMERVTKLYGDKYDYSKCGYSHKTPVTKYTSITCKIHGDFKMRIDAHVKGQGCPQCKWEATRRTKPEKKTQVILNKTENPNSLDSPTKAFIKVQFSPPNSQTTVFIWSEPFNNRIEAEELISNLKMYLDMTDSVLIEAIVLEMKAPLLDSETVLKIIKCLNLESYAAYIKWWDETHPTFIPRNLHEHYPTFNLMFNGKEVGVMPPVMKTIILPDYVSRKTA
jgi:hypothetical protein